MFKVTFLRFVLFVVFNYTLIILIADIFFIGRIELDLLMFIDLFYC